MILPPDSDAIEGKTYQSLAKMQNLNLPAKKTTQQTQSNVDILQNKGLYSSKTNDFMGKRFQGLSQVKGYMTTKIKLKRN